MGRATSSSSNPPHQSIYLRGPSSIPSPLLPQHRIVGRMQWGMYTDECYSIYAERGCRYMNGSILIAALQPSFTILHTLTTARAPSPIVSLAWHASSSKQKSDMLATQSSDGDLRVWSVAKPPTSDNPKVIRVLKRSENYQPGPNWLAWSKNGRIVQYSEGYVDPCVCVALHGQGFTISG